MSDQALTSSTPCFFWSLPQEILDMIFTDVYSTNSPSKYLTKPDFENSERKKYNMSGGTYTRKVWTNKTHCKVNDFLVSKAFFANAARAWMSAQKWPRTKFSTQVLLRTGLFKQFGTHLGLALECQISAAAKHCRSLQAISLRIDDHDWEKSEKLYWMQKLGPEDFDKMPITAEIKKLSGLKELTIERRWCTYAMVEDRKAMVEVNRKAYEEYLQGFVTRPRVCKPSPETMGKAMPLYPGSLVRFDSSEMLPKDFYDWDFIVNSKYTKPNGWKHLTAIEGVNEDHVKAETFRPSMGPAAVEEKKKPETANDSKVYAKPFSPGGSTNDTTVENEREPETADELLQMLNMMPQKAWQTFKEAQLLHSWRKNESLSSKLAKIRSGS